MQRAPGNHPKPRPRRHPRSRQQPRQQTPRPGTSVIAPSQTQSTNRGRAELDLIRGELYANRDYWVSRMKELDLSLDGNFRVTQVDKKPCAQL